MSEILRVQIVDFRNGAYPVTEIRNKIPYSQTCEIVKQLLGNKINVAEHCNLYYKATVTFGDFQQKVILICKKDCLLLQS